MTQQTALEQEVAAGRFRLDLFYRLDVVSITSDALKDRPEDIEPRARHFVESIWREFEIPTKRLTPAAIRMMQAGDWPGNPSGMKGEPPGDQRRFSMGRGLGTVYGVVVYVFFLAVFVLASGVGGKLLVPKGIDSGVEGALAASHDEQYEAGQP